MGSLERLKDRILKEHRDRAEEILSEARVKAQEAAEEIRRRAGEEAKDRIARAKAEADEAYRRARVSAELAARNAVLAEKGRIIEEAFSRAPRELSTRMKERYPGFLRSMMERLDLEGLVEVTVAENDRTLITEAFLDEIAQKARNLGRDIKFTIVGTTPRISGGALLRTAAVEIDCSTDSAVRALQDQLEPKVAEILFKR